MSGEERDRLAGPETPSRQVHSPNPRTNRFLANSDPGAQVTSDMQINHLYPRAVAVGSRSSPSGNSGNSSASSIRDRHRSRRERASATPSETCNSMAREEGGGAKMETDIASTAPRQSVTLQDHRANSVTTCDTGINMTERSSTRSMKTRSSSAAGSKGSTADLTKIDSSHQSVSSQTGQHLLFRSKNIGVIKKNQDILLARTPRVQESVTNLVKLSAQHSAVTRENILLPKLVHDGANMRLPSPSRTPSSRSSVKDDVFWSRIIERTDSNLSNLVNDKHIGNDIDQLSQISPSIKEQSIGKDFTKYYWKTETKKESYLPSPSSEEYITSQKREITLLDKKFLTLIEQDNDKNSITMNAPSSNPILPQIKKVQSSGSTSRIRPFSVSSSKYTQNTNSTLPILPNKMHTIQTDKAGERNQGSSTARSTEKVRNHSLKTVKSKVREQHIPSSRKEEECHKEVEGRRDVDNPMRIRRRARQERDNKAQEELNQLMLSYRSANSLEEELSSTEESALSCQVEDTTVQTAMSRLDILRDIYIRHHKHPTEMDNTTSNSDSVQQVHSEDDADFDLRLNLPPSPTYDGSTECITSPEPKSETLESEPSCETNITRLSDRLSDEQVTSTDVKCVEELIPDATESLELNSGTLESEPNCETDTIELSERPSDKQVINTNVKCSEEFIPDVTESMEARQESTHHSNYEQEGTLHDERNVSKSVYHAASCWLNNEIQTEDRFECSCECWSKKLHHAPTIYVAVSKAKEYCRCSHEILVNSLQGAKKLVSIHNRLETVPNSEICHTAMRLSMPRDGIDAITRSNHTSRTYFSSSTSKPQSKTDNALLTEADLDAITRSNVSLSTNSHELSARKSRVAPITEADIISSSRDDTSIHVLQSKEQPSHDRLPRLPQGRRKNPQVELDSHQDLASASRCSDGQLTGSSDTDNHSCWKQVCDILCLHFPTRHK